MLKSLRSVVQLRRFEWNSTKRKLAKCANVEDLRKMAKRRLPGGVFDYFDGAAEDERTYAENESAFAKVGFKPRVLVDVDGVDTSTSILGQKSPLPLVLAPTGFTRIATSAGELDVARAAGSKGLIYTLSTLGTRSIEEVAQVATSPLWYQLYVWRDRGLSRELVARAREAGYRAIMVTVDTAVFGRRERDVRRGFTLPPKIGLETFIDGAIHPRWTLDFLTHEPITFSAVAGRSNLDGSSAISLADYVNEQFDASLTWDDLEWIRSESGMPVMLKGVQTVADAEIAVKVGLDAISLSNHGGRQLDDAPAPLDLLPQVVDAVGGSIEVYIDGGVRRGSDVVKAVALGARAALIGRSYLYALGAAGQEGVEWVLDFFNAGIRRTMALLGAKTVQDLDRSLVRYKTDDPA